MSLFDVFWQHLRGTLRARSGGKRRPRPPLNCSTRPRCEELESRLLLHANAVMDAEHLAVFGERDAAGVVTKGLVPDAAVTFKSVQTGNWSNPDTWLEIATGQHRVPTAGANVLVTAGTTVTV